MATTIKDLEWNDGAAGDETERGWWFAVASPYGPPNPPRDALTWDIVQSGTLEASSDREEVLRAVAHQLGVDSVTVA